MSLVAGLLIGAVVILATGGSVAQAFAAFLSGALGGRYEISETLVRAIPLLFTGLAVAVAFRGGVWNIGAEGQLLAGATAVAALGRAGEAWPAWALVPMLFVAAAAAGAAWGGIAAFLKVKRNVPEVIATIMLNFLALNLVSALIHGPLIEKARSYPQSEPLSPAATLPVLVPPARVHAGLFIAIVVAAAIGVWLFRSVHGYRVRVVGQNLKAAEAAGFDPPRIIWHVFLLGGAIAGLGGAVEMMGVNHILTDSFSPGWGYTAIAVALLGELRPAGVCLAALLFGALDAGAGAMEAQANVSHVVAQVVQGVVIFIVGVRTALAVRAARET
ncbi:MAG TPA: ABC transporter permease [Armatimonadota bacterium]|jgi:simple sugar transport system permease protein